jgi:opacity protein-like surface antigen
MMTKKLLLALSLMAVACPAFAQELYVNTEPASNMATHSVGIRLENQGYFNPVYKDRTTLEVMYGASRNLMIHGALYESDYYESQHHFEGGSVYAKYRFLSIDSVQQHFRGSFFVKASDINNPVVNQEISLEGDNSGIQSGLVFTQLLHKLAFSGSASYLHAYNNSGGFDLPIENSRDAVAYTLSAGYLLLPKSYENYNQVNLNLYVELLGKTNPGYGQSYLDAAPALQLIFNSIFRVDFSYRTPLYNDMVRTSKNAYLVRLEYNIFNVF